tara:strand:+ start:55 stop:465 length:411 start_codon:yes stop_codon:yes gene_type:complete
MERRHHKNVVDMPSTLAAYENRISSVIDASLTAEEKERLHNTYLSTYDCYSTILNDLSNDDRKCNPAVVLMRVLRANGVNILGVTSERTQRGAYVAAGRAGMGSVEYVGKHMFFTNKQSHPWRILPCDRRYLPRSP